MDIRKLLAKAVRNWPVKVLSIGLAIILFVFHRMSSLETRFFSVPLAVENLHTMMPSASYPRMIRISLRGEADTIFPVLEDDIAAYVDMVKFNSPGTFVVPVQWRRKGTAQGTEPLQITVDPPEIRFRLDNKISKFVPLVPDFNGQVDSGYVLTSYSLNPNQVVIDGPAEIMADISELYTEPIGLDGRGSDFSGTVNILNRNPLIVIRGNGTADFHGNISRIIPVRNIFDVPVAVTGEAEGFSAELEPRAVSLRLEGESQDAVDRFAPPPDFLRVDCSGIGEEGTYVLRILTGTAAGIQFRAEPQEVTVRLSRAEEP